MKKFLWMFILGVGTLYVSAESGKRFNNAFVRFSSGFVFQQDFSFKDYGLASISLGKILKNNEGDYRGEFSLGIFDDNNIGFNYGYSFLGDSFKTERKYYLGAEGSILIGSIESDSSEDNLEHLGLGGKLGLYGRFQIWKRLDLGVHVGLYTKRNIKNLSEGEDYVGYTHFGFGYYFH